ncbi:MAG: asparaginase [Burkholderiales bacterium]|nr:asparaginase [Burkholderiales bacterium]
MKKPLVCVVGTGGTIASKFDPKLGGHASAASAQDLVAAVPELTGVADVRVVEHSNINSALMDTPTAFGLRDTLRKVLKDDSVSGVVVTHGTDTLEETAYLMDLTLGSDKPVVITGAQRNFDEKDPDGPRNLLYATMVAAHPDAHGRGVLVALGGEIHAAYDATKVNPEILTCVGARDGGAVGMVTKQGVTFFSVPQRRLHLDVDHVKQNVHIIRMAQGASDLLFRACVSERVDGIVVEGTGGGNVNVPFYDGVCAALDAGIPVVAGIRLPSGAPHPGKAYKGSWQSLINKGAISSGYLSGIKARILLMVALAHTGDRERLREIFARAGGV